MPNGFLAIANAHVSVAMDPAAPAGALTKIKAKRGNAPHSKRFATSPAALELAKPLESARYARAFGDEARLLQARRTTLSMALAAPAAIYTPSWTIAGAGG